MRKLIVISVIFFSVNATLYGQTDSGTMNDVINDVEEALLLELQNPENWNATLQFLELQLAKTDSTYWKWLNGLNLEFKTFQNKDSTESSLGFGYDLNLERAKITSKEKITSGKSFSFETRGNVAFHSAVNPYDFLNSKLALTLFRSGGGVEILGSNYDQNYYTNLRRSLAGYTTVDQILNSEEWQEMNNSFELKNSWILKPDLNAGIESNQEFSRYQYTSGIRLGAGIKAWDEENLVSKLNILDYPFHWIRQLTGYDGNIHPGITVPSVSFGFDYVYPQDDKEREIIAGELEPFPRINFEGGFRTVITEVTNEVLYFNCSVRYFKELNAPTEIVAVNLDEFFYFTSSITTSTGFFVSYSLGELPFDRQRDAVYEIGFRYRIR